MPVLRLARNAFRQLEKGLPPVTTEFTITYPPDLPITARREEILAALRGHQVVIVAGETGSGKTTQLPKMCLEAGLGERGRIGCTQPRRVAALSISRRVAEELRVPWGREVGCKMRFNDDTGARDAHQIHDGRHPPRRDAVRSAAARVLLPHPG